MSCTGTGFMDIDRPTTRYPAWNIRRAIGRRNPERKDLYGTAAEKRERGRRADEFAGVRGNLKFTIYFMILLSFHQAWFGSIMATGDTGLIASGDTTDACTRAIGASSGTLKQCIAAEALRDSSPR